MQSHPPELLGAWLIDCRQRTLQLVEDLTETQLIGPRQVTRNPLLWELGHLAWFAERWLLRRTGAEPLRPEADKLYDPVSVPQAARWDLRLPSPRDTFDYLRTVYDRVLERLDEQLPRLIDIYFYLLTVFHEDIRAEAIAGTRQALEYPPPDLGVKNQNGYNHQRGPHPGDATIPGGRFLLGAMPGEPFVFDNEKWAYPVDVRPFAISRAPVTQAEFTSFVEAGGYSRREWWTEEGWGWRTYVDARHPVYWRREGGNWLRRDFDRWVPLEPHRPVVHLCWFEADAYCRWARRRLPSEAEWELAAASQLHEERHGLSGRKRRFPWGEQAPNSDRANLDGLISGCVEVAACSAGDSAWGCRQMLGNVWEWTANDFLPYPGFAVDPDPSHSQLAFTSHKVIRGGSWLTRARLLRNTYRGFSSPDWREGWIGFRTCAIHS